MPDEQNVTSDGGQVQKSGSVTDLESWIKGQPEEVQQAFETHIRGLKNALAAERDQRKTVERQLRDAAAKLEKDSEARKALEQYAEKLRLLERQSAFYDAAHAAGCTNLRLAFIAANDAGLIREDGTADWETMRAKFPELFGRARTAGDAKVGDGHDKMPSAADMNAFIRRAAGRV